MSKDLLAGLDRRVASAVQYYWSTRQKQGERQGHGDDRDRGLRSAVTGGGHLDGFANLIADLLVESGVPKEWLFGRQGNAIPGYFRPNKEWDLVVVADGRLLASVELKSQAGPSYGNNFNNRAEEALGNATDLLAAYEKEILPSVRKPWMGYLLLLEEDDRSMRPVAVREPHFAVDPVFEGASYARRYQILCERLLREQLYDSACFLLSEKAAGLTGGYHEPHEELRFRGFAASLLGEMTGYLAANQG